MWCEPQRSPVRQWISLLQRIERARGDHVEIPIVRMAAPNEVQLLLVPRQRRMVLVGGRVHGRPEILRLRPLSITAMADVQVSQAEPRTERREQQSLPVDG